jgi:copper oxidase (laccase) domain-containing protein
LLKVCTFHKKSEKGDVMPKRSYIKRNTAYDSIIGGNYSVEERSIELLISTLQDGNMDPRFSSDAHSNYRKFLEKHSVSPVEAFSPALGQNYRIITIDESNEEKYAGRFVENGNSQDRYQCDAVIVCNTSLSVTFRVGDCPVVLIVGNVSEDKKIISLVHAGRAELTAEVPKNAAARMASIYRMHLSSATAYILPHICRHCYGLEYLDQVIREKTEEFWEYVNGRYHLDLSGWLTNQLAEAGIRRISTAFFRCTAGISPVCVSRLLHDKKIFKGLFSHYRSFHQDSVEGRFLVAARIIEQELEEDE